MFSAIRAGGFIMLPIILCGIAATFIIIERCFYFYVTKKRDVKLMYDLNSYQPRHSLLQQNPGSYSQPHTSQIYFVIVLRFIGFPKYSNFFNEFLLFVYSFKSTIFAFNNTKPINLCFSMFMEIWQSISGLPCSGSFWA